MMAQRHHHNARKAVTITRLFAVAAVVVVTVSCTPQQIAAYAQAEGIALTGAQTETLAAQLAVTAVETNPKLNWAALRKCESGGNYGAVSKSGKYRGAYQFNQQTWNGTVASFAPSYHGVRPDQAPAHIQDAAAQHLYNQRGRAPWPHCGKRL